MPTVSTERAGSVAVVSIAAPETRNALTTELLDELVGVLIGLDADPGVRAVVLTGGTTIFASGANVRELRDIEPAAYALSPRLDCWRRLNDLATPMVSAVAGPALGGGAELALLADLVVAADNAVFGQPEVRLGILPGAGGTQRWARAAGRYVAAGLVLAARTVDAFEARDLGIVDRVVPAERVVAAATELAGQIAAHAPLALRSARGAVRRAEELPLSAALEHERAQLVALLSTEDHREGIDAFLEKRAPDFTGR